MSDTDTKEKVDGVVDAEVVSETVQEPVQEPVQESTESETVVETKSDGIKLSDGLVGLVVDYLGSKPFSEVAGILLTMDGEIASQGKRIVINHPKQKEETKEEVKEETK